MSKSESKIIREDASMNTYSAKRSFSNIASSVSLIQEGKRKKTLCKRGNGDVTIDSALKPLVNNRPKFQINRSLKKLHKNIPVYEYEEIGDFTYVIFNLANYK